VNYPVPERVSRQWQVKSVPFVVHFVVHFVAHFVAQVAGTAAYLSADGPITGLYLIPRSFESHSGSKRH
jgi:hypothetical protein